MARLTGPKCKLCRAEGIRLFLRGMRCESSKCPFSRGEGGQRRFAPSRPGQQSGQRRRRMTEYGRQLREKQKLKRFYGVFDKQFQRYYEKATRMKGNAGINLLVLFESRLDNVLCLSGYAASRNQARQFINHGFVYTKGHRIDIASYLVSEGEEFTFKVTGKTFKEQIKENLVLSNSREAAKWIDISGDVESELKFKVVALPTREQVSAPVNEQLIVELCSK